MFYYKTVWCPFNLTTHNKTHCVYAHHFQDFRRRQDKFKYVAIQCENWNIKDVVSDYLAPCKNGYKCNKCHGWKELEYHPNIYKTTLCISEQRKTNCIKVSCPFYHNNDDKRNLNREVDNLFFEYHPRNRIVNNTFKVRASSPNRLSLNSYEVPNYNQQEITFPKKSKAFSSIEMQQQPVNSNKNTNSLFFSREQYDDSQKILISQSISDEENITNDEIKLRKSLDVMRVKKSTNEKLLSKSDEISRNEQQDKNQNHELYKYFRLMQHSNIDKMLEKNPILKKSQGLSYSQETTQSDFSDSSKYNISQSLQDKNCLKIIQEEIRENSVIDDSFILDKEEHEEYELNDYVDFYNHNKTVIRTNSESSKGQD